MFCPKCKLYVRNMDFCEQCGGATIKADGIAMNEIEKTNKNDKLKFLISGVIGVVLTVVIIVVFNILNKPKTTTLEKALKEYYHTSNKEGLDNEVIKPQISQETSDELKTIADEFILMYYSNAPKENYEQFFSPNSTDYYNDNSNGFTSAFEFERSTDDKTEIQNIESIRSSLEDDAHATIHVRAMIIRDGYDYEKITENVSAPESAIIRVEDSQTFIFKFEKSNDSWLILSVSKPLI